MTKEQITELQGYGCSATNYEELIDWVKKEYDIKIFINFDGEVYTWKVEGNEEYDLVYNIISNSYYSKELYEKDIVLYLLFFLKIKNISNVLNLSFREIEFLSVRGKNAVLFEKVEWEHYCKVQPPHFWSTYIFEMKSLKEKGIVLENEKEYYVINEVHEFLKLYKNEDK